MVFTRMMRAHFIETTWTTCNIRLYHPMPWAKGSRFPKIHMSNRHIHHRSIHSNSHVHGPRIVRHHQLALLQKRNKLWYRCFSNGFAKRPLPASLLIHLHGFLHRRLFFLGANHDKADISIMTQMRHQLPKILRAPGFHRVTSPDLDGYPRLWNARTSKERSGPIMQFLRHG